MGKDRVIELMEHVSSSHIAHRFHLVNTRDMHVGCTRGALKMCL